MRIGWLAVIVLLAGAGGVGWYVTQTPEPAEPARTAPAAQAAAAPRAFDPGAPLNPQLQPIAARMNSAMLAADAQPMSVVGSEGGADDAMAASTAAQATTPAERPATQTPADGAAGQTDTAADTALTERTAASATNPVLVRAQVMLDRAHFSPGVIDGRGGENTRNALMAFERAAGLDPDGRLDPQAWAALMQRDANPAVRGYVLTAADVAGPFVAEIPSTFPEMARLERLAYKSAAEALAEKFHMDEDLLRELNPGVDFGRAGQTILVAAVGDVPLPGQVDRIEVDQDRVQLRAYAGDRLLAVYPATVGSSSFPSPRGEMTVQAVAANPNYTYNPEVITFGRERNGDQLLTIPPGPNNPVGGTWIDLSEPTYGIHGAPEPSQVGKTASHGCVRLTNWDAAELGRAVRAGTRVVFTGTRTGGTAAPATTPRPT